VVCEERATKREPKRAAALQVAPKMPKGEQQTLLVFPAFEIPVAIDVTPNFNSSGFFLNFRTDKTAQYPQARLDTKLEP